MPASISLADIRTRVLERANMLSSTGASSGFVSTAELNAIINGEAAELYEDVADSYSDQFTTSLTFAVASGTNAYAVDASVWQLVGVDRLEGSNFYPLDRCSLREVRHTSAMIWNIGCRLRYHWASGTLYFDRVDASGSYRLWYIPEYVDLAADGDTLTYPNNWFEYIFAGAAAKLLAKEESDPSVQLGLKAQAKARIMTAASNRDVSGPETVRRMHDEYDDFYGLGYWSAR